MTESDIVWDCLQFLALKGVEAWPQNQGAIPLAGGGFRRLKGKKGIAEISGTHCGGGRSGGSSHPPSGWVSSIFGYWPRISSMVEIARNIDRSGTFPTFCWYRGGEISIYTNEHRSLVLFGALGKYIFVRRGRSMIARSITIFGTSRAPKHGPAATITATNLSRSSVQQMALTSICESSMRTVSGAPASPSPSTKTATALPTAPSQ